MGAKTTVAINGFGRIGRAILRAMAKRADCGLELVAINDIAPLETCAYLLEFDSVYGPYPGDVVQVEGGLEIDGAFVRFSQSRDLATVDLADVDIVLECTGKAGERAFAEAGLRAGARRVLISGPSPVADATVVLGANEAVLGDQPVISNASCTTNALAPLLAALEAEYGVVTGHMTTIHCYTGSQPTVDAPRGSALERNRAAALSMVPTTTSAARLIDDVLPALAGRVKGCAVRVPTASVSAIDMTVLLGRAAPRDEINGYLARALPGLIGAVDRPLVSQDLRARPESFVLARPETTVLEGGLVRIFGWYDNEFGFSNRMIDVALRMG